MVSQIFNPCFSQPTFERVVLLGLSAIVTTGVRTTSNLVRTIEGLTSRHPNSYHHVFSNRRWRPWQLSHGLLKFLLDRFVPTGAVHLVGDDTTLSHPGRKVFGKGRHRDAHYCRMGQDSSTQAQDTAGNHGRFALRSPALVSKPPFRLQRGWWLWDTQTRSVRSSQRYDKRARKFNRSPVFNLNFF